jgi:hypothetical protein
MRRRDEDPDPVAWLDPDSSAEQSGKWSSVAGLVARPDGEAPDLRPRIRPGGWYLFILASLAALVVVGLVQRGRPSAAPTPRPSPSRTPSSSAPIASPTASATSPGLPEPIAVTDLHRSLLDVPAGWDLYGRSADGVVRIELARGRITRTALPPLSTGGPVSFVVGPGGAIVRPMDAVTGYFVPDGHLPRELDRASMPSGPVFPGPDPAHIWISNIPDGAMVLADFNGHRTGPVLQIPQSGGAWPDGRGYLMFSDIGGTYEAGPHGVRRITTGQVLAVGPTRWLTGECDDRHECTTQVIDRATGARTVLSAGRRDLNYAPGAISPDGKLAAILGFSGSSQSIHLLDLTTGADRQIAVTLDPSNFDSTMVWSPDSRWLFSTTSGRLSVIDRNGRDHKLAVSLPPVTQMGLRTQ